MKEINAANEEIKLILVYGQNRGPIQVRFGYDLPAADKLKGALVQSGGDELLITVERIADRVLTIEIPADLTTTAQRQGSWYLSLDYGGGRVRIPLRGPYEIQRAGGGGSR